MSPRFDPPLTRRAALRRVEALLRDAGLDEPQADARILLEGAAGLDRADVLAEPDAALPATALATLDRYVDRRLAREPVFRILGRREFWGLDLAIGPAVLDPRPDTETVVLAALDALKARRDERLRILDLGTGSGALLCALLTELPRAQGVGVDLSVAACAVARSNLKSCGLSGRAAIVEGRWADGLEERFDLIVSNPPYIETAVIAGLAPEVRDHDPALALDGGPDGLDAYRAICPALPALLRPSGLVVLEVGAGQAPAVETLLREAGLTLVGTRQDLGGHARAVVARL